jgi:predicted dehydrogenase
MASVRYRNDGLLVFTCDPRPGQALKVYRAGLFGAGDFARIQSPLLLKSRRVSVASVYDPNAEAARATAERLGAQAVESPDAIFADRSIDLALVYTPPFTRRELVEKAVAAGKDVITTKPLAPTLADARAIAEATANGRCLVIYKRTGNAQVQTLKRVLDSGEVGSMALYHHDWIHHFPYWAPWALDPGKNGGPLVDAMIHNLNTACFLAGREVTAFGYHGYRLAQDFAIPDTELLVVDFEGNATAHLSITWAADLAIYDAKANDRERIDVNFVVTDQRWLLRFETREGRPVLNATRDGHVRLYPVEAAPTTLYDRWAEDVEAGRPVETSTQEALRDIELALHATAHPTARPVPRRAAAAR